MLRDLPKTGVVIPCYQEAKRLPQEEYLSFSRGNPGMFLLFVNDGSNDGTQAVLEELKKQANGNIEVLDLKRNLGKAEAVRLGINHLINSLDLEYVGFLDADLSTPLSEYKHLLNFIASNKSVKMVCGARIRRMGANIERSWSRHCIGRILATVTGLLILKIPVYDTQCGAKIFDLNLARSIFKEQFVSRWFFDIEIYCRVINNAGYEEALKIIYEVPLQAWRHAAASKITLKTLLSVPLEMFKIYLKYNVGHYLKEKEYVVSR